MDGTYLREWIRDDGIANLIIVHGVGEHSGRYIHVADYFFDKGFNIFTCDLVGHGKSDGLRTHVKSIKDYHKSVDFMINRVNNSKPIFIFGHSMGGLIVLNYSVNTKNPRVNGVIISSPYIKEAIAVPAWKYIMGRAMSVVYPKLRFETGLKGELVCRDKKILAEYDADELNCSSVTAGWYMAMVHAREEIRDNIDKFNYPCCIMQAGNDIVAEPKAVKEYYDALVMKDKSFKLYEGYYHELVNDPERDIVLEDMYKWLMNRIR